MSEPPPRGGPGPDVAHASALLDLLCAAGLPRKAVDALLGKLDGCGSDSEALREKVDAAASSPELLKGVLAVLKDPEAVQVAIRRRAVEDSENGTALICEALRHCDTRNLARVARVCRGSALLVRQALLWQERCLSVCSRWAVTVPEIRPWREAFYEALRPRCDGIYVGECRYLRAHEERRTWINYRRYLRLFPPDAAGLHRALVLQDPGPLDLCLEVLLGLDPKTHVAAAKQRDLASSSPHAKRHQQGDKKSLLEDQTCTATYEFFDGCVHVTYPSNQGEFNVSFRVGHQGKKNFSERLEWAEYSLTDQYGERDNFRLDLNSRGDPKTYSRVHYPVLEFRYLEELGHYL